MKLIVTRDYEEMSQIAADIMYAELVKPGRVNASLTAGRSPQRMYEILIPKVKRTNSLNSVYYYMFDETPIINENGDQVGTDSWSKVNDIFYAPANVPLERQINITEENYQSYDQMIANAGGLDVMLIGMGSDGHFCANMPECTSFNNETYRVELSDEYPWNRPFQESLGGNIGKYMYSIGPKTAMKVRHMVLIVNGKEKARMLKTALEGPVVETVPTSVLQLHPNFTVIADADAASELSSALIEKHR